jgi:hypothetical protein
MLYMVVESYKPGAAPEIYRRARERGRQLPDGLEYIESWVDLTFTKCFQLMHADDTTLFARWIDQWKDLVSFEVIPVQTSAQASATFKA